MKKILLFGVAICCILMFGSCKSKQSAYKTAYEQAASDDDDYYVDLDEEVITTEEVSYEPVRTEQMKPLSGENASGLRRYSVVIGAFGVKTNAYSQKERMIDEGYIPVIMENNAGLLRVIVTTFDTRADAVRSRDNFKRKYAPNFQDAWIFDRGY